MNKKRVACWYRVSTKKQLDKDNKIERQKISCRDYVEKHPDWIITNEYQENGVSGYKKSNGDRAVMQQTLNDEGVEVYSVNEGKMAFDGDFDDFKNMLIFKTSADESKKISKRTDEKLEQISKEGMYTGGLAPYGYDLVLSGVINKKGKEIKNRIINEEEAKVVKEIFKCSVELGYGKERIAKHLNERLIKSKKGLLWNAGTVGYILKNPIYKGFPAYRKKSNKTRHQITMPKDQWAISMEQQKNLVIVDELVWEKAQKVRENHTIPLSQGSTKITKSPLLFVGILKCADCGSPMTTTYSYKYNNDKTKTYVIPKYRCSGKSVKNLDCKGQTVYSGKKVDETVLRVVYDYLSKYNNDDISSTSYAHKNDGYKLELKKFKRK